MALTINQIITQAAIDVGLDAPSGTLVSSSDKDVILLHQMAINTARELRSKYRFPQLKKTHTITTSAADRQYTLPSDFWAMLPDTNWDETNSWPMGGPLSDSEYKYFTLGIAYATNRKIFRVFGSDTNSGQFFIYPDPAANETLSFDYIRSQLFFPKAWSASESVTSGTTYRSASGNIYLAQTTTTTGATFPSHTSGTASDGAVTWLYDTDQLYGTGEKCADDNDFFLVDDDLILAGTVWRYLKRKGLDYGEEKQYYERESARRYSRLKGASIINLGDGPLSGSNFNIPEGNFNL